MATPLVPTSAQAFQFRMSAGFPGTISRQSGSTTIEPGLVDTGNPPVFYGQAVVQDSSAQALRPPTLGDTVIAGITVRAFPTQGNFPATPQVDPIGTGNVPASGIIDCLKRGYISVTLSGSASAVKDAPAYAWTGATAGGHVNGGIEAAASYAFVEVANGAGGGGSNTGTGTFTTGPTAGTTIKPGAYSLKFLTATTFTIQDPTGNSMPNGTSLVYSDNQISFTITAGGTAFVAGDGFLITAEAETIPLQNAYFTGPADTNGITELAYNI